MVNTLVQELSGRVENPILRVGLDLDLTCMNNDVIWAKVFNQGCVSLTPHRPVALDEVSITYDWFKEICQPCFYECCINSEIVFSHDPLPFVSETVRDLHGRGVQFEVITARVEGTNQHTTFEWLEAHNIAPYVNSVTFTRAKRATIERLGLDIMVDDSPHVHAELLDEAPASCELIMIEHPYNRNLPSVTHARNWMEVHRLLSERVRARAA